jgi:hypothetical protein
MEVVYIVAVVAMLLFGALGIWVLSPSNDADASGDASVFSFFEEFFQKVRILQIIRKMGLST